MEAVVVTGGRQYRVRQGQKISVNKLDAKQGDEISLNAVALIKDDGMTLGRTAVQAKVLRQHKGEKVTSATYKRRKGYHKKKGHRQQLTEIEIQKL